MDTVRNTLGNQEGNSETNPRREEFISKVELKIQDVADQLDDPNDKLGTRILQDAIFLLEMARNVESEGGALALAANFLCDVASNKSRAFHHFDDDGDYFGIERIGALGSEQSLEKQKKLAEVYQCATGLMEQVGEHRDTSEPSQEKFSKQSLRLLKHEVQVLQGQVKLLEALGVGSCSKDGKKRY